MYSHAYMRSENGGAKMAKNSGTTAKTIQPVGKKTVSVKLPGIKVTKSVSADVINAKANLATAKRGGTARQIGRSVADTAASVGGTVTAQNIVQTRAAERMAQSEQSSKDNSTKYFNDIIDVIKGQAPDEAGHSSEGESQTGNTGSLLGG